MSYLRKTEWSLLGQVERKISKKQNKFIVINIIIPIILGALIYYLISPEVIFVRQIDNCLRTNSHIGNISMNNLMIRFVRNYFMDMLWGYALVFALFLIEGNNAAELKKIFIVAFAFSAIMEILQMTPIAKGTFDVCDIIAEFFAEVIAVFIIKNFLLRRNFK